MICREDIHGARKEMGERWRRVQGDGKAMVVDR